MEAARTPGWPSSVELKEGGARHQGLGKKALGGGAGLEGSGAWVPGCGKAWGWETWEAGAPIWRRLKLSKTGEVAASMERVGEDRKGDLADG